MSGLQIAAMTPWALLWDTSLRVAGVEITAHLAAVTVTLLILQIIAAIIFWRRS